MVNTINEHHIDWIDGAKGVAIISVFLLHSIPCLEQIGSILHIGQGVPVFLFITAYLSMVRYKSFQLYFTFKRFSTMLKRIFIPFFLVLVIQIVIMQVSGNWWSWKSIIKDGGIGPGSYYAWLFLQVWIIIPFIIELIKRCPVWLSFFVMIVISVFAEFSITLFSDFKYMECIYRLLAVRYLLVLYAGCVWSKITDKQKIHFYVLAGISGVLMVLDIYAHGTVLTAYVPTYWSGYHWYTALYVLIPIILLHKISYAASCKMAGKYSWQLFLLQMFCFSF